MRISACDHFSHADRQQEPDGDPQRHLREGVGWPGHALRAGRVYVECTVKGFY